MLEHTYPDDVRPVRVVVVGAHGFVGKAVLRRLAAMGIEALGIGRQDVDLLAGNAADSLARLLRPGDAVVAAAAIAPCRNADMLADNMVLARSLVKAVARVPVAHVINIGSDAVYADSAEPLVETSTRAPDTLHGAMHLSRELMFASECRCPLATLRPSLLYGPDDPHNGYGPNRFRRLAARGEPIVLFGEGEELRDHVFIDDVSELALKLLLRRSRGTLNVATGELRSFHGIAEDVVRLAGSDSSILTSPRNGPMPHNGYRAFDTAACRQAFPDFRYTGFDEGMARTLSRSST